MTKRPGLPLLSILKKTAVSLCRIKGSRAIILCGYTVFIDYGRGKDTIGDQKNITHILLTPKVSTNLQTDQKRNTLNYAMTIH